MREKPEEAHPVEWEAFNIWADDNGVGEHPNDWLIWFDCWHAGAQWGVENA